MRIAHNSTMDSEFQIPENLGQFHCEFCRSSYSSKQKLLKHLQISHKENIEGEQKGSAYDNCNEKFVDEIKLKEHLKEKPYSCIMCSKHFVNENEFEAHKSEHSNKLGPFQCDFCPNSYMIRDSLRTHVRRIHRMDKRTESVKKDTISCEVCGEIFYSQDDLTKHVKKNIYMCDHCQKHWSNLRAFKYHMNKHSNEQQVHNCEFCYKSYVILDSLKIHIRRHHRDVARKREEGRRKSKEHKCNMCSEGFFKSSRLRKHMNLHSKLMLMECQMCGIECSSREGLRQHVQQEHRRDKLYTCATCNEQFPRYYMISRHLQDHRGGKPHRCELCERQFSSYVHLDVHKKRRHDGVKPYTCDTCDFSFFRRKFMMLHSCKQKEIDPLA